MSLETRSVSQPIDQGMPPLAFSSNGHISTIEATLRRQELWATLTLPVPNVEVQKEHTPGVVVLVPIHTDARIVTMQHTLESLARQGHDQLRLVVADNGLSYQGRTDLAQRAQALGVSTSFADALPTDDSHRNPAHARTKGIELIRSLAEQHPEYRTNGIVFLDSDTAALPGAIRELQTTYQQHKGAVAVTAVNVAVPTLNGETYARFMREISLGPRGEERVLPRLYSGDKVDVAAIAGFGSDVALKTCGVFVDRQALDKLASPFIQMPYGSAEDMVLSAALGQLGDIYHNPNARVLDQTRESQEQLRMQRQNWGRDHAILFADLAAIGLVPKGIHVLEPEGGKWVEWVIPHAQARGIIINPRQLRQVGANLREALEAGASYGPNARPKLETGLSFLNVVLSYVDVYRPTSPKVARLDLPTPTTPDPTHPRFSKDGLTGLLSGNILGMHDVQEISSQALPNVLFYGVRQAGKWN